MSEAADRSRAAEASRWFTVMTRTSITADELKAFRDWRRDPANADALANVKRTWEAAGALAERPEIAAATEAALAARPPKPAPSAFGSRFRTVSIAAGLASLVVVVGGAIFVIAERRNSYATEVGGQRLAVLSDGSRVRLNTDTKIRVAYSRAERRIRLVRGEAFFEAARDSARPFIVETGAADVRALGTKFDVRRDNGTVQVTLLEGRVLVQQPDRATATTLSPNQSVSVTPAGISTPRTTNAAEVSSWTSGRLTFSGVPLRDAVAEVNRYSTRKIVLVSPGVVADELISGQFEPGDTDTFIDGVRAVYGLKIISQTGREIRVGPG